MMPKRLLFQLAPFAVLLATAALVVARQREEVSVRIEPVDGNVSVLFGAGGNIGLLVGPEAVLIVDSQFDWLAPKNEAAIVELAGRRPTHLVNTHWHGDHTGGNPALGDGARIVAHRNVRARLGALPGTEGRVADPVRPEALPETTFSDELSLHLNGEEVRLVHVPSAHTDGDTVVWFRGSNVVHMGDLYFSETYPFFDVNSGGSIAGLLAAVESVLEWVPEDARVVPGHGKVTGVAELRTYRDMLDTLVSRVREALAAGMTADDMLEGRLSEDYDERWGGSSFVPPERFVRMLAEDLAE